MCDSRSSLELREKISTFCLHKIHYIPAPRPPTLLVKQSVFLCSVRKNHGHVFSLKLGSYKFVMASSAEAVKEMLVKRSADYAGRPQSYVTNAQTLGR